MQQCRVAPKILDFHLKIMDLGPILMEIIEKFWTLFYENFEMKTAYSSYRKSKNANLFGLAWAHTQ